MNQYPFYLTPTQRVPGYLPYPHPVGPGPISVPNASSVDWPQAQFAPPFLPPGSPSFSPYQYPEGAQVLYSGDEDDNLWRGLHEPRKWGHFLSFVTGLIVGASLASRHHPMWRG